MELQSRVLVTGADGLMGSHIVDVLRKHGCLVISGKRKCLGEQDTFLDIVDVDNVEHIFSKYQLQYIIHCAAYGVNYADKDMDKALSVNIQGSLNLLYAASRMPIKRFVHIGSCFEYGSYDGPIPETALPQPTDIYGSSKAAATLLMRERADYLNVPLLVLRPFGIWGPGEKEHRLVPQILTAYLDNKILDLTPCNIIRDYTYIEDMAKYIVSLCFTGNIEQGLIVNIGSGKPVRLKDFVIAIARNLGCEKLMNFGSLEYRQTEMKSILADITRLQSLTGAIEETSLDDGLQKMLSMYRNHY